VGPYVRTRQHWMIEKGVGPIFLKSWERSKCAHHVVLYLLFSETTVSTISIAGVELPTIYTVRMFKLSW